MPRFDPIRTHYYEVTEQAEGASDLLFYLGAALSILYLFVDKSLHPKLSTCILIAFAVFTLSLFTLGLVLRFYLIPRALDRRRQDFFSNACGVNLTHEQTGGYYNNDFTQPIKRIAAQVLENSLFTKTITLQMLRGERTKITIYAVMWLICLFFRSTDLDVVVAASQAVFSEQILAKWIRLEWLRIRSERVFDDVYRLFQSRPALPEFSAITLDALSVYETTKSNAAITLSSKTFEELNPTLSTEWDSIKTALKI